MISLLESSVLPHQWYHYSVEERADNMDIELKDGFAEKAPQALHFAVDKQWVETSADWIKKTYRYKYRLVNFHELRILEISMRTIGHLQRPKPCIIPGLPWNKFKKAGYDGVYIHCDEIELATLEERKWYWNRWKDFVHLFDVDTLVIWKNARMEELPNDYPPPTADSLRREEEFRTRVKDFEEEEEKTIAAMSEEEKDAYAKGQKRKSRLSHDYHLKYVQEELAAMTEEEKSLEIKPLSHLDIY